MGSCHKENVTRITDESKCTTAKMWFWNGDISHWYLSNTKHLYTHVKNLKYYARSVMCATEWVKPLAPKEDISWHAVWYWANQMWSRLLAKNMQTDGLLFKSWVFCKVQWALNSGAKQLTVMNKSPTQQQWSIITTENFWVSMCIYLLQNTEMNTYTHYWSHVWG